MRTAPTFDDEPTTTGMVLEPAAPPAAATEILFELLSVMRMGAILVTAHAQLITANQAGRDAMDPRFGLVVRNGRLFPLAIDARRKFTKALMLACAHPFVDGAVLLGAPGESKPYRAMRVVALERVARRAKRHAAGLALLCVGGPRSRTPESDTLAQLYGLTTTEASLMAAIARGDRLFQCADERGVSLATVRAQLRNVFIKTGAQTQADLVAIAWSIPGLWLD